MLHATYRRILGKRRIFLAFVFVIILSITYLCYQAFSIHKLGEELSAEYVKRKDFHINIQSYQKADFPIHLLNEAEEQSSSKSQNALPVAAATAKNHGMRISGVLNEDVHLYIPNSRGNFKCLRSKEEIVYLRVNDDFCDCQDGSDEPSTSACHNGRFYCSYQPSSPHKKIFVPSNRVNDGICDCCDGSDEWGNITLPVHSKIDDYYEIKLKIDQVPCKNQCSGTVAQLATGLK